MESHSKELSPSSAPFLKPLYGKAEGSIGYPPGPGEGEASGQEQTDCIKELTNKLAWVLGSTYKSQYSHKKGPVYHFAQLAALGIVRAQGYSKSK